MITPDEQNQFDNRDDYANNEDTAHQFGEADSASFNERQFEETAATEQTETQPDSNMDNARFNSAEQNAAVNQREDDGNTGGVDANINQQPLTTQGSSEEREENLGGTTNLTLDQLKKEHDPEGTNNA